MARGLALVGALAAAAGARAEVCDGVALAQWSHRVTPAALEAGPTDFATLEAPTGMVPRTFLDVFRSLPAMVNQSISIGNSTAKSSGSAAGPVNSAEGMPDMMHAMQVMFEAVKSEAFMGNATWLIQRMTTLTKAAVRKGEAALDRFSFFSRTAKDKEMPGLAVWLFNNCTNNTLELFDKIELAVNATSKAMPREITDMLDTLGGSGGPTKEDVGSGTAFRLMPENSTLDQVCHMSDTRILDVEFMAEQDRKAIKFINGTQRMLPMMKDYISAMRPDVAPRIEYLINLLMDRNYDMLLEQAQFLESLAEQTKPVLKARMGCKMTSHAPRAASAGLLPLALLLTAWLFER